MSRSRTTVHPGLIGPTVSVSHLGHSPNHDVTRRGTVPTESVYRRFTVSSGPPHSPPLREFPVNFEDRQEDHEESGRKRWRVEDYGRWGYGHAGPPVSVLFLGWASYVHLGPRVHRRYVSRSKRSVEHGGVGECVCVTFDGRLKTVHGGKDVTPPGTQSVSRCRSLVRVGRPPTPPLLPIPTLGILIPSGPRLRDPVPTVPTPNLLSGQVQRPVSVHIHRSGRTVHGGKTVTTDCVNRPKWSVRPGYFGLSQYLVDTLLRGCLCRTGRVSLPAGLSGTLLCGPPVSVSTFHLRKRP